MADPWFQDGWKALHTGIDGGRKLDFFFRDQDGTIANARASGLYT
jgi:hypothetical protein